VRCSALQCVAVRCSVLQSNLHGFELHRPSSKGTKLPIQVIKAIINQSSLNQTKFKVVTQAQTLLGKAIGEHTTQQIAEVKGVINKDRQVVPEWMPLCARLAVNKHNNMGERFVESIKNTLWSMSPQEAWDGLESKVDFSGPD